METDMEMKITIEEFIDVTLAIGGQLMQVAPPGSQICN